MKPSNYLKLLNEFTQTLNNIAFNMDRMVSYVDDNKEELEVLAKIRIEEIKNDFKEMQQKAEKTINEQAEKLGSITSEDINKAIEDASNDFQSELNKARESLSKAAEDASKQFNSASAKAKKDARNQVARAYFQEALKNLNKGVEVMAGSITDAVNSISSNDKNA